MSDAYSFLGTAAATGEQGWRGEKGEANVREAEEEWAVEGNKERRILLPGNSGCNGREHG